jgi:hypothetical protein
MIGITLSAEQIRNAPPPVRQWIEQEVMTSLGLTVGQQPASERKPAAPPQAAHLVGCNVEEAAAILRQIEDQLPAVNVFFEFARRGIGFGQPPLISYRLMDIMHHARLASVDQVMALLGLITAALTQLRRDPSARFCSFDSEGHCFVAPETQASIAALWQDIIERNKDAAGEAAA